MLKCSAPTWYDYITGSPRHLSAETLWFTLFSCDTPRRSVTWTQQICSSELLFIYLFIFQFLIFKNLEDRILFFFFFFQIQHYHLTSAPCQHPHGHVLISGLDADLQLFFTVSHLWYHSLCLGSNVRTYPSVCLRWEVAVYCLSLQNSLARHEFDKSALDLLYLSCHGGFLVIPLSANATCLAVWMCDGTPEAVISDWAGPR